MPATNKTTHYEFPLFVATDKPTWLGDWNSAMTALDTAIYEASQTGSGESETAKEALAKATQALTAATEAQSAAAAAQSTATSANSSATSALGKATQNETDISDIQDDITTMNAAITTAQGQIVTLQQNYTAVDSKATTASTNATTALTTAQNADTKAGTAQTNAQTALTTANEAKTTASAAQTGVNNLQSRVATLESGTPLIIALEGSATSQPDPYYNYVSFYNVKSGYPTSPKYMFEFHLFTVYNSNLRTNLDFVGPQLSFQPTSGSTSGYVYILTENGYNRIPFSISWYNGSFQISIKPINIVENQTLIIGCSPIILDANLNQVNPST